MPFTDLGLGPDVLARIAKLGFETPTPVQAEGGEMKKTLIYRIDPFSQTHRLDRQHHLKVLIHVKHHRLLG